MNIRHPGGRTFDRHDDGRGRDRPARRILPLSEAYGDVGKLRSGPDRLQLHRQAHRFQVDDRDPPHVGSLQGHDQELIGRYPGYVHRLGVHRRDPGQPGGGPLDLNLRGLRHHGLDLEVRVRLTGQPDVDGDLFLWQPPDQRPLHPDLRGLQVHLVLEGLRLGELDGQKQLLARLKLLDGRLHLDRAYLGDVLLAAADGHLLRDDLDPFQILAVRDVLRQGNLDGHKAHDLAQQVHDDLRGGEGDQGYARGEIDLDLLRVLLPRRQIPEVYNTGDGVVVQTSHDFLQAPDLDIDLGHLVAERRLRVERAVLDRARELPRHVPPAVRLCDVKPHQQGRCHGDGPQTPRRGKDFVNVLR